MDYHTNYIVRLITETEYSSLYKWCLQEFDSDGKQVGRDLIPWAWPLYFKVTRIRYAYSLENDDPDRYRFDEKPKRSETDGSDMAVMSSEVILGELVPAQGGGYRTSYSMVGTNRQISTIQLRITKADKDTCAIWGSVSYTSEIDSRDETFDDIIEVHLQLTPEKFDELARMINSGRIDEASLRLKGVSGFYSDWSPGISTDFIKVLTPDTNDHKVEAPENTDINPPRLGRVQEFQFELNRSFSLN